jgi:hypothetical protein
MTTVNECRDDLRAALLKQGDVVNQVRRAYFDRPSFALSDKHDVEFEIKKRVANRYSIPFRSVVFAGSAQLGFSPQQDTLFRPGQSDLDIACIDSGLYQKVWQVMTRTRALKDLSGFLNKEHSDRMADHLLRRGMILLDFMPNCPERNEELTFFDQLGREHRRLFNRVSLALYMNEWAFCWKQASALSTVIGDGNGR